MRKYTLFILLILGVLVPIIMGCTGCTPEQDEQIRENTRVPGLDESVQARDMALESAVQQNIETDLILRWYAQTYGITVEVSHAVATVQMKVKTEEQRDTALQLARTDSRITDVVDNIEIDPNLDDPPFEL
jgi:hypothetical protein